MHVFSLILNPTFGDCSPEEKAQLNQTRVDLEESRTRLLAQAQGSLLLLLICLTFNLTEFRDCKIVKGNSNLGKNINLNQRYKTLMT